jgi:hypothetical protein
MNANNNIIYAGKAIRFLGRLGGRVLWHVALEGVQAAKNAGRWTWAHRHEIAGSTATIAVAAASTAASVLREATRYVVDMSSLLVHRQEKIKALSIEISNQSRHYHRLITARRKRAQTPSECLTVGGDVVADITRTPTAVPEEVERAFSAAFPGLHSQGVTFSEAVRDRSEAELAGLLAPVKGKLFELRYVEHLNSGYLPEGYVARIAESANQPGWDIAITGPDAQIVNVLQAKATDSIGYVREALERYPDIDVVTTDEVFSQLIMTGTAEQIINSGISDLGLEQVVGQAAGTAADAGAIEFHFGVPVISLALIAFTSYQMKDLSAWQRARRFGHRAGKSWVAYALGGAAAWLTQTWWLGIAGAVGARLLAERGHKHRELWRELEKVRKANARILHRLEAR